MVYQVKSNLTKQNLKYFPNVFNSTVTTILIIFSLFLDKQGLGTLSLKGYLSFSKL